MTPRALPWGLCLSLVAALGCARPLTQIVVLIDTDMPQGPDAVLTHLRVTVKSPATGVIRQRLTYALGRAATGARLFELPAALGVTALDNDGSRSVEVDVDAVNDPGGDGTTRAPMFTYYAVAPFEQERTGLLTVFLAGRCRSAAARCQPDETCGVDACTPRRLSGLPEVSPEFRPDGGARPASADATLDDRGPDATADATADVSDARGDLPASDTACEVGPCGGCAPGSGDCDGVAANGCEASLQSVMNCGACGSACALPNVATQACVRGACAVGACPPGRADCDGEPSNGCEADTQNDGARCGGCSTQCPVGQVCDLGACSTRCATGLVACGSLCADVRANPRHCGACGNACPARANTVATCAGGRCGAVCNAGFGDCDGDPADGCEAALTTAANCGACGRACSAANAAAACSMGGCGFTCSAGFGDCDGAPGNGCETDLRSSATSCGSCRAACSLPHATAGCAGGLCRVDRCDAGFANCNGVASDGCEVNLNADGSNCGSCGTRCAPPAMCGGGACVSACPPGTTSCGGACVDLLVSTAHCGRCGNACPVAPNGMPACVAGVCSLACNPTWQDCDGDPRNGCELRLGADCSSASRCLVGVTACLGGAASCRQTPVACGTRCMGHRECDGAGVCLPDGVACAIDAGAASDAGVDAGVDAGIDAGVDVGIDAGVDVGDVEDAPLAPGG